jgi:membrane fusion protein (multidrug efflux system)
MRDLMKKKIILFLIIILGAVFARLGYSMFVSHLKMKVMKNRPAPTVSVETIKEKEVLESFDVPGRVVSKYQVSIIARVSGYLQKSYFKEGDYVKAGDTLFLIEPLEFQNANSVAGANVKNIEAQLAYADKQLKRAEDLVRQDYISKSRYDELLANKKALEAQLQAAKSNLADSNRQLNYTKLKAPVDGRVGIIDVTVGNYVSSASGSLTTINSTNPIYVTFPLSSDQYSVLMSIDKTANEKRKVELYFPNGKKYEYDGVQDFLDNKVEQTTGTVTMRATFSNPDNKLLHGEFVNLKLYANSKILAPIVPIKAVQENQEGKFVYVLDDNNLPKLTYIQVNGQIHDNWIVNKGLKVGDKIIVDGIMNVVPNSPVQIITKNNKK